MMLIGKEIVRERAKNVCIALEKITKSFGCVSMPNDTKDIQEKLVELDQTLPYVTDVTKSTTPAQPTSDDRKARKEKLLAVQPPMKTSHRSDRLPNIEVLDVHGNLSSHGNDGQTGSPQSKAEASTHNSGPRDSTQSFGESLNNVSSNRRLKGVASQNVISAFYDLKRKERTPNNGNSANLAHHFKRKDRDIVSPDIISNVYTRLTARRNSSSTTGQLWQRSGTKLLFCSTCWRGKSNLTTKMEWTSHSQKGA